ncbi:MAG: Fic family protein [Actinobacteria bacterium]|nr:Fic family protein [Actinomycetota bacterium]MBL7124237.1 Fic family protein [Actinomycetota bacterium]
MFKTNFKITNKIIKHIADISAARELILNASLLPQWEVKLRRDAIAKMAHHSTSIEGNPLTLEQVKKLLIGNKIAAWEKDKNEVLNYVRVLEYIDKLGEKKVKEITEDIILKIHQLNTKGILPEHQSGFYRKVPVAVVNGYGRVIFQPPPVNRITTLMKDFISWLNSDQAQELYPVLLSGISHYEFVRIHPFIDGNGRTARALATLILYLKGFDTKRFFALDDYYNEDRDRYYAALQTVDQKTLDTTQWLEYFCEGVAVSMNRVKDTVLQLSHDRRLKDKRGQIFLNEKQIRILKYLQTGLKITTKECQDMFNVSERTARNYLNELVKKDLIKPVGPQKGRYYILT